MTPVVFVAVIAAAFLHATWNALVKGGTDKRVSMAGVVLGHVPIALGALLLSPMPAPAAWPYIGASILLHVGYQFFLLKAYEKGDLTQVYPIARGSAPLIVAAVSVMALGVHLAPVEILGICTIGAGILSLALVRHSDGLRNGTAAALALGTGLFIAAYSLVDGLGARAGGTAVGFYAWTALGNTVVFAGWLALTTPGALTQAVTADRWRSLASGTASFVAYGLVVWAFTQAPIALVTALRETSIIFALLIGVFVMGERLNLVRVASTMITLCGVVLLRIAKT